MDYELAKQIYKKGSPFKSPIPVTESNIKYIDFPPLEELLDACGEKFGSLNKYADVWDAEPEPNYDSVNNIGAWSGSTPQEAVARLYLALK